MSHYETPEQRQIRELRTKISAMTSQANYQASQNNTGTTSRKSTSQTEISLLIQLLFT